MKSGLGKEDEFKKKSTIKKLGQLKSLRQTDQVSFYLKRDISLPKDLCDGAFTINELPDLDIIKTRGRKEGESVLYDPVQESNYLSISARYERSLLRAPDKIEKRGQKTIYFFCSSESPSGFWEVEVGGSGTFINFTPKILTIICPRPFRLQEFVNVATDGDEFVWQQLQGRGTIISPLQGEGSLNPFISIIGQRTPEDPPIFLLAELASDETIFDIVAIRTTVREFIDGVGGDSTFVKDGGFPLEIPCTFSPVVDSAGAFCWHSGSAKITFRTPATHQKWVKEYWLQENIDGVYTTIQTSVNQLFEVSLTKRYRILAIFNILGTGYSATESCRFAFNQGNVLALEKITSIDADSTAQAQIFDLKVSICPPVTEVIQAVDAIENCFATQYPLAVKSIPVIQDTINGAGGEASPMVIYSYNLLGAIIG